MNVVRAKCRACAHVWVIAELPMLLEDAARQMAAAQCPRCADDRPYLAAKSDRPPALSASGVPIIRRRT